MFVLHEIRTCFNYVLNVKCLRANEVEQDTTFNTIIIKWQYETHCYAAKVIKYTSSGYFLCMAFHILFSTHKPKLPKPPATGLLSTTPPQDHG